MSAILLCAALAALWACQSGDPESGAPTLDREFAMPADDVWKASLQSAESMGLRVSSDIHDRFGGEVVAFRATGSEVRIWVTCLDERHSQVSVRVESGDRTLAAMLQERIAEKLGLAEARAVLLGGNVVEATYSTDLGLAMLSARRAFRSLQLTLTDQETHADWASIDGRLKESIPVRIRIDRVDPGRIRVTFICGNERSEDNRVFARRMKDEYEAASSLKSSAD
jgi:hypothetical protein